MPYLEPSCCPPRSMWLIVGKADKMISEDLGSRKHMGSYNRGLHQGWLTQEEALCTLMGCQFFFLMQH